ncbi:MAG: PAS domain S-box protein [Polyangiaceae bacterium]
MAPAVPEALHAFFGALPDALFVHDPSGGVLYANRAGLTLLGLSEAEIVGRPILDVVHPNHHAEIRRRLRDALEHGQLGEPLLVRFLARDGAEVETECRGAPWTLGDDRLMLVVARDLTTQRRAERELARTGGLFRTLVEELRVGVLVQGPRAEILSSNRAALELLGLDDAQLLGMTSFDPEWNVIREDGLPFPAAEHPVPMAITTRRPVRGVVMGVYRPRRRDRVWLLVDAEPQLDAEGSVLQVVCTFSDCTALRRTQAQAAAGDRLTSLGRLAAGVAHEINNPLTYVIGRLNELLAEPATHPSGVLALSERARAHVAEALEGAQRVRAIVDDLRSLSRGEDQALGPVDLGRVVASACNIAAPHLRHRARLVRDVHPTPAVLGNEARLGQLVLNLLVNAAEAIEEGHVADNEVRVILAPKEGGRVVLEVRDTGSGIPAAALAHIFDPFFTTKPVGVGTGLGLAISHGIVMQFGGEIDVESLEGRGSTFRVSFPATTTTREPSTPPQPKRGVRARVLVIDDEPRVAEVLAQLLGLSHDVEVEPSAARALERMLAGERWEVVCCDLMMPEMTGMDLQEALEAHLPEMAERTLFTTGGAFTPRARAFVQRLGSRALEKPFDFDAVERAVAEVARGAAADPSDPLSDQ